MGSLLRHSSELGGFGFIGLCVAIVVVACGGDPAPQPSTPTATAMLPTNTPTTGAVSASNIPFPTRIPRHTSTPWPTPTSCPGSVCPTSTPGPTATPTPTITPTPGVAFEMMELARESMEEAGSFMFTMDIVLDVQAGGRTLVIPITYSGEFLVAGFPVSNYSSGDLTITTPTEIVQTMVVTVYGVSSVFDESALRWDEIQDGLPFAAFSVPSVLFGSRPYELMERVGMRQFEVTGRRMLDGEDTHVISGSLLADENTSALGELDVVYWIGVEDGRLRQMEVNGEMGIGGVTGLLKDLEVDTGSLKLTARFSHYGKDVHISSTPHLVLPRFSHGAFLLDDDRVLVTGGWTGIANNNVIVPFPVMIDQIYDIPTATWSFVGMLTEEELLERPSGLLSSSVKLADDRIMAVGVAADGDESAVAVFNPYENSWTPLPIPSTPPRFLPSITLLREGRVLVAGGLDFGAATSEFSSPESIKTADIFDPGTGTWKPVASMNESTNDQSIAPLKDGRALVVRDTNAEIYDPAEDTWTFAASTEVPRFSPGVVTLSDGRVLVTGRTPAYYDLTTGRPTGPLAEVYNPVADVWTLTSPMSHLRISHTLTLLPDGRVLAAGGEDPMSSEYILYSTTEIYDPRTNLWSPGPNLSAPRASHSATLLPDGNVLLVGGIGLAGDERYPLFSAESVEPR